MSDRRSAFRSPLLAALAVGIAGMLCATVAAQTVRDPDLQVETYAFGLAQPTSMQFVGNDEILVLQKNDGRVRHVVGGVLQPGQVLDVAVNSFSERGLLGIARDPDFVHNRYVYLFYTESATGADGGTAAGNRVYRYTWNGSALVDPLRILDLPVTPGPNHDGGVLAFGPDDRLYVTIGDLNRDGKLQNYPAGPGPDDTGSILRVDPLGRAPYDNPFVDPGAPRGAIDRCFAYGVRNSFGLAFDPVSGALWDTENGEQSMDEINRVDPGLNSGWERIMGPEALSPGSQDQLWMISGASYSDPEFSWLDTVAPTALTFAASRVLGCQREHDLIVADANCGQLYRFELTPARDALSFASLELADLVADNFGARCSGELAEVLFAEGLGVITDVDNGPDGRLYVLSLTRGTIDRIGPRPDPGTDVDGDAVNDACDCDATDPGAFAPPLEVPRLRLSERSPLRLGWDAQSATAGSGTRYTVVSGELGELVGGGGFAAACELATGLAVPAATDDRPDPLPGEGRYYLVRAGNGCDPGTYGDAGGAPDPRDDLDAAVLTPCN